MDDGGREEKITADKPITISHNLFPANQKEEHKKQGMVGVGRDMVLVAADKLSFAQAMVAGIRINHRSQGVNLLSREGNSQTGHGMDGKDTTEN